MKVVAANDDKVELAAITDRCSWCSRAATLGFPFLANGATKKLLSVGKGKFPFLPSTSS
jgi:hypothetical protein